MHGGMKFYRGSAAAARAYVEADHSRADDYYLVEGSGVATRFVADVSDSVSLKHVGELDGQTYERWVAGYDTDTGAPRGRLRDDPNALRFVEVTVNGPKTWSLAPQRCIRRFRPPWTPHKTGRPDRSSAGSPSTRLRGSGRGAGKCKSRSSRSRRR